MVKLRKKFVHTGLLDITVNERIFFRVVFTTEQFLTITYVSVNRQTKCRTNNNNEMNLKQSSVKLSKSF